MHRAVADAGKRKALDVIMQRVCLRLLRKDFLALQNFNFDLGSVSILMTFSKAVLAAIVTVSPITDPFKHSLNAF